MISQLASELLEGNGMLRFRREGSADADRGLSNQQPMSQLGNYKQGTLRQRAVTGRASFLAVALATFAALPAFAQGASTIYLWDGSGGASSSVKVGAWGNGDYEVQKDVDFVGQNALEVRTRNFYEGVRFTFARPYNIEPYRSQGILRLRLRSDELALKFGASKAPTGQPGSYPFGASVAPNPNIFGSNIPFNPRDPRTGMQQPTPAANPGNPGNPNPNALAAPTISQIQVVLHLEHGALFGTFKYAEESARPDGKGWQAFSIPLSQMKATPDASGGLKTVVITGDREGSFLLGQLALVPSRNGMAVSIRRAEDQPGTQPTEVTVAPGQELKLVADAETGDRDVYIDWNFDADNTGALPSPTNIELGGTAPGNPNGGPNVMMNPSIGSLPSGINIPPQFMRPGMPGFPGGPGNNNGNGTAPISMSQERLDARGVVAQITYPNEEQNYRVEATLRDRVTKNELGKGSLIVKVRTPETQ